MADIAVNVLDDIVVSPELVIMGLEAETDQEAIGIMARMLYDQGYVKESYIQAVKEREKEFFTGLGFEEMGVAMPHTDAVHVNRQAIGIGILKKPVRFRTMGELDGALDVQLMFMLAINKPDKQLDFLSHMIDSCQKEGNLSGIYHAADPTEAAERFKKFFLTTINKKEIGEMKRILLVCGSGICTSTAVNQKVSKALDERGLKGQYKITQGKASEVAGQSSNYDLCISTTVLGGECHCPLIIGTQFLLGRNTEKLVDEIVEILSR